VPGVEHLLYRVVTYTGFSGLTVMLGWAVSVFFGQR
jgi:hypothetical protein